MGMRRRIDTRYLRLDRLDERAEERGERLLAPELRPMLGLDAERGDRDMARPPERRDEEPLNPLREAREVADEDRKPVAEEVADFFMLRLFEKPLFSDEDWRFELLAPFRVFFMELDCPRNGLAESG